MKDRSKIEQLNELLVKFSNIDHSDYVGFPKVLNKSEWFELASKDLKNTLTIRLCNPGTSLTNV